MRALGIDLGTKRIGIAVSDRSGTLATPVTVLQRSGSGRRDLECIARLVAEHEAQIVVVGVPRSLSGRHGPAARAAVEEAQRLATLVDVPVVTHDERFSTVEAQQRMRAAGRGAAERRTRVDMAAAAVILQSWLDGQGTGDGP